MLFIDNIEMPYIHYITLVLRVCMCYLENPAEIYVPFILCQISLIYLLMLFTRAW